MFRRRRWRPSAEVERARCGRGVGSLFPWGDVFDGSRCNDKKNRSFDSLCAVTDLPEGANPSGIFHLVGNAGEFTATRTKKGGEFLLFGGSAFSECRLQGVSFFKGWTSQDGKRGSAVGFRCAVTDRGWFHLGLFGGAD